MEARFDSEKSQFFDETRHLFEERTLWYGQKKEQSVIKKVSFVAQRLASKHALRSLEERFSITVPASVLVLIPTPM